MNYRKTLQAFLVAAAVAVTAPVLAAGPSWMPGFPMRMGTNVMLMWTPVPGASGYNVYKSDKEGTLGSLLVAAPANNYMDANVPMDKSAYYTVKIVIFCKKLGSKGDLKTAGNMLNDNIILWSAVFNQGGYCAFQQGLCNIFVPVRNDNSESHFP